MELDALQSIYQEDELCTSWSEVRSAAVKHFAAARVAAVVPAAAADDDVHLT